MINNTGVTLVSVVPTGSPSALTLQPITDVVGLAGPYQSVLYVDTKRGLDATGQRGNENAPFRTIQAAINAMQPDDLIQISPETHTLLAPLTIPSSVIRFALAGFSGAQGSHASSTTHALGASRITATAPIASLFELSANLGLASFMLSGLQLVAQGATTAIFASGGLYAQNTFLNGEGMVLENLHLEANATVLTAKYLGKLSARGCTSLGSFSFDTCGPHTFIGHSGEASPTTEAFDATDPLAPTPHGTLTLQSSQLGDLIHASQGKISVDPRSSFLSITGLGLSVSGASTPSITYRGSIVGAIDYQNAGAELPDTATVLTWDFRTTRLIAPSNSAKFKVGGAGANPQQVRLDGCNGTSSVAIGANTNIVLSARGASFPNAAYATVGATGSITPPSPYLMNPVAVAGPPTPIAFGFRITSTDYQVTYESDNAASVPTGVVTAKTTAGFSVGTVAAGGGNVRAVVNFN